MYQSVNPNKEVKRRLNQVKDFLPLNYRNRLCEKYGEEYTGQKASNHITQVVMGRKIDKVLTDRLVDLVKEMREQLNELEIN